MVILQIIIILNYSEIFWPILIQKKVNEDICNQNQDNGPEQLLLSVSLAC